MFVHVLVFGFVSYFCCVYVSVEIFDFSLIGGEGERKGMSGQWAMATAPCISIVYQSKINIVVLYVCGSVRLKCCEHYRGMMWG